MAAWLTTSEETMATAGVYSAVIVWGCCRRSIYLKLKPGRLIAMGSFEQAGAGLFATALFWAVIVTALFGAVIVWRILGDELRRIVGHVLGVPLALIAGFVTFIATWLFCGWTVHALGLVAPSPGEADIAFPWAAWLVSSAMLGWTAAVGYRRFMAFADHPAEEGEGIRS
ncbi:hypothetical protein HLB44_30905 [Aquincola sp. S2]|uniref:Uncharacterized protein n=1 Tax=Pseudaquabacterium terrae TaxID=2732868 RepID=A0ABX2ERU3_9BURK|nr:hypothetical protein [Aquabacterium terrae]NRF71404.1 hypothetical protein [Aquabacterium terrae]